MCTAGQDKHLFILEPYCAEAPRAEKIDSGMYQSVQNTVGVSDQEGEAERVRQAEGRELRLLQPHSKILGFS